jgi:hypothetical protein
MFDLVGGMLCIISQHSKEQVHNKKNTMSPVQIIHMRNVT